MDAHDQQHQQQQQQQHEHSQKQQQTQLLHQRRQQERQHSMQQAMLGLPRECLWDMFSRLSAADRCSVSLVCRMWFRLERTLPYDMKTEVDLSEVRLVLRRFPCIRSLNIRVSRPNVLPGQEPEACPNDVDGRRKLPGSGRAPARSDNSGAITSQVDRSTNGMAVGQPTGTILEGVGQATSRGNANEACTQRLQGSSSGFDSVGGQENPRASSMNSHHCGDAAWRPQSNEDRSHQSREWDGNSNRQGSGNGIGNSSSSSSSSRSSSSSDRDKLLTYSSSAANTDMFWRLQALGEPIMIQRMAGTRIERLRLCNCSNNPLQRGFLDYGIAAIAQWAQTLRSFEVHGSIHMRDDHFCVLAEAVRSTLEALRVYKVPMLGERGVRAFEACRGLSELYLTSCAKVMGSSVLALAGNCRKLRRLELVDLSLVDLPKRSRGGSAGGDRLGGAAAASATVRDAHAGGLGMAAAAFMPDTHIPLIESLTISQPGNSTATVAAAATPPPSIGMPSVEQLRIAECTIDPAWFASLCCSAPALHTLAIHACPEFSDDLLGIVASGAPGLKALSVRDCEEVGDGGIAAVVRHCSALERVELAGCGSELTAASLLRLALVCSKLKAVAVKWCAGVRGDAVFADDGMQGMLRAAGWPVERAVWMAERGMGDGDRGSSGHILNGHILSGHILNGRPIGWREEAILDTQESSAAAAAAPAAAAAAAAAAEAAAAGVLPAAGGTTPASTGSEPTTFRSGTVSGVERLDLEGLDEASDALLAVLARLCPRLTRLRVEYCKEISSLGLSTLFRHCHQLKWLRLAGFRAASVTDATLATLGLHCLGLRSLSLKAVKGVGAEGLLQLLQRCSKLECLSISLCQRLRYEEVEEALQEARSGAKLEWGGGGCRGCPGAGCAKCGCDAAWSP